MTARTHWMLMGIVVAAACGLSDARAEDSAQSVGSRDRVDEVMGRYNLQPAFEKGGRGLSNVLFGWLEIPLNIDRRYSPHDNVGSMLTGAGIGVFKGVVRTGVGLYETLTFFLPYPENFAPILPTLEYFQKASRRKPLPLE